MPHPRLRTLLAAAGACLAAAWLAGCVAPPPAVEAAPEAAAAPQGLPAAPAPALRPPRLVPPEGPAEPALRLKPERMAEEGGGAPALRLPREEAPAEPPVLLASGTASWYADRFHGRLTANGERYDREELTAAHRSLPFGTRLCVRSRANGRMVVVRVNDRGPFTPGRIIDLSRAAAEVLGMTGLGIKPVELWQLGPEEDRCPEGLEQAVEGAGLGLDAGAQAVQHPAPARGAPRSAKQRRKPRRR